MALLIYDVYGGGGQVARKYQAKDEAKEDETLAEHDPEAHREKVHTHPKTRKPRYKHPKTFKLKPKTSN